jgi:uncharacterized protein YfaP (DUF2135 family)
MGERKGGDQLKKRLILGIFVIALIGALLGVGCKSKSSNNNTNNNGTTSVTLEVTEPQDEITVNTSTIQVKGVTTADATVSVNGFLVDVGADGKFSTTVSLEQGPNSIEVVASDSQGNENSQVLTVIYAL